MTELIDLLKEISIDKQFDSFIEDSKLEDNEFYVICDDYFKRFSSIYVSIGRHKYSKLASFAKTLHGDELSLLSRKISLIISCATDNNIESEGSKEEKECYLKLQKLLDHLELQIESASGIGQVGILVDSFKSEYNKAIAVIDNAQEEIKNESEQNVKLKGQLISILGIFAGIVVSFSFSITTIGSALSSLSSTEPVKLAFIISLLGVVFINAICLLMVFVAKLSGFIASRKIPWITYLVANFILIFLTIFFYCKL